MRRLTALMGMSLALTLVACAEPGQPGQPAGSSGHPASDAFQHRAAEVADAWQNAPNRDAWHKGYVPLQDATVLPVDPGFDDAAKLAFSAGWYEAKVSMPEDKPADGTIRFSDGVLDVPLISAAEAYGQLAQGDSPSCPPATDSTASPSAAESPASPDSPVDSGVGPCRLLTVTKVALDSVTVRTSRGEAQVPAWLFTVAGLKGPVARLAVAPSAVSSVPEAPPVAEELPEGLVSAQDLTGVDGATLSYRLGVGACDTDITPLVYESEDVVVLAGAVTRSDGICTDQLVMEPVTIALRAPLGARTVLDAASGQPLLLTAPY